MFVSRFLTVRTRRSCRSALPPSHTPNTRFDPAQLVDPASRLAAALRVDTACRFRPRRSARHHALLLSRTRLAVNGSKLMAEQVSPACSVVGGRAAGPAVSEQGELIQ
eukprot:5295124-Pleurochrysis_carterae.AAC.10